MQTVAINLYTFEELALAAQRKVIERDRFITVDDPFWYEPIIEEWSAQLEQRGFEQVKILFSGFGSQGDGACFTAIVNIEQFLHALGLADRFPQVIEAAQQALIEVTIRHSYRHYFATSTDVLIQYDGDQDMDDALAHLQRIIEDERKTLGNAIYKALDEEFYYQISDEIVKDTLIVNEYTYLADGRRFTLPAPV